MKKKQTRANMKPNTLPYGLNPPPQSFQYPGGMNPQYPHQYPPNMGQHPPNMGQFAPNVPPQHYGPPQGFKGGYGQGPPMNMGPGMGKMPPPPPQVFPKNQ